MRLGEKLIAYGFAVCLSAAGLAMAIVIMSSACAEVVFTSTLFAAGISCVYGFLGGAFFAQNLLLTKTGGLK